MTRDFSDQEKIFNPDTFGYDIHIIGAGGIGNMLIQLLAKMGVPELHVWDDDHFEVHNGPTEVAYSEKLVGEPKVDVAAATVDFLVGDNCKIVRHYARVTPETKLGGIVISGVDSMESRKAIWAAVKEQFVDVPLYVDARSGGEEIMLFNVVPCDFEASEIYENDWLFEDEEASELPCGARNIGYISTLIASVVGANLAKFVQGKGVKFNQYLNTEKIHEMF